jgi:hypothetical protein
MKLNVSFANLNQCLRYLIRLVTGYVEQLKKRSMFLEHVQRITDYWMMLSVKSWIAKQTDQVNRHSDTLTLLNTNKLSN